MSTNQITKDTVYLSQDELLKRWRFKITKRTLDNWRSSKQGPSFIKACGSALYPLDAVIEYERCSKMN